MSFDPCAALRLELVGASSAEPQQRRAERTMRTALERAEGNLKRASDDWYARIAAEHAFMIETVCPRNNWTVDRTLTNVLS
jgi:hypothetical protein